MASSAARHAMQGHSMHSHHPSCWPKDGSSDDAALLRQEQVAAGQWQDARWRALDFLPAVKSFAGRLQKQQQAKLLDKMGVAYAILRQGDLLNPNQIRAALLSAQDNGAV